MVSVVTGGDKLEAYLQQLSNRVSTAPELRVGFLAGATYPDGTPVAMVAAIQEYGAPGAGIPPRPFFRNMMAQKSKDWGKTAARLLVANNMDVEMTMNQMGAGIASQLQQSIIETNAPPLSEVTLMLRQMKAQNPNLVVTARTVARAAAMVAAGQTASGVSKKPLVDTGHLLNSVGYEVSP